LWADDDASLNRFAERVLGRSGFELSVAADLTTAASLAARRDHDVIVLDQRLPGADDLDLLRRLRVSGDTTPVVILTGFGSLHSAVQALTWGIVDYLEKPASAARIVATLRIAIRMSACAPLKNPPAVGFHRDVSLAFVSALFNLGVADIDHLRTQLAWAAADDQLSFAELVAVVEALRTLLFDTSESETRLRSRVGEWLRRAGNRPQSSLEDPVQAFVRLITSRDLRLGRMKNEALAEEAGTSLGDLSRLVHAQVGVTPERCQLIAHLQPAISGLAHSGDQVAQVGYRLGYNLPSAFDNVFKKLWGVPPTIYREILAGFVRGG
jgi:DNA-binding response OmpR family regulator/AraC-like DNA-binding protein